MSRENVEIVRQATEAYRRGALAEALAYMDPAVEWDMSHVPVPDPGVYRGFDELAKFDAAWAEIWDTVDIEALEYIEVGDRVISVVRQQGRGKLSGVAVEQTFAQLWTLRDGKIVRVDLYPDLEEAKAAAESGERAQK
jgi:uncharacterized protein